MIMPEVAITIPSRTVEFVEPCVNSITASCGCKHIWIVDDGLTRMPRLSCPDRVDFIVGEKPFVFARNINLGLRKAYEKGFDAIVLNDDTEVRTFSFHLELQRLAYSDNSIGLVAPLVDGACGNLNQKLGGNPEISYPYEETKSILVFIAVFVPHRTIKRVGFLDERFVGYGHEDDDYCLGVRQAGLKLLITDRAIVKHSPDFAGSFAKYHTMEQYCEMSARNKALLDAKWPVKP